MNDLTLDIYIISRYTHSYYAREFKKLNISMGQFSFILGVALNDGISQEKLSAELMIGKSTTATIVKQLLDGGFLLREPDAADGRLYHLHCTEKALRLVPEIQATVNACHDKLTVDLTPIERQVLCGLLEKVRARAEKL